LGKGKGGLKWETGEVGDESEEGRRRGRKWERTKKIVPKRNRFGTWDVPCHTV